MDVEVALESIRKGTAAKTSIFEGDADADKEEISATESVTATSR